MDIKLPEGGLVIGVGTDIIEIDRIRRVYEKHPERFLTRVFTEQEREYCVSKKNPLPHLAARFAAKEAISKTFTTGIGKELGWKSMEVVKGSREEPIVALDEQGMALLKAVGGSDVLLSLSHTDNYAQAVAVLVKQP